MQRLNFSTVIEASREKLWKTMLDQETYREWTSEFMPGSHYVGDWSDGSKMLFLGPGEQGETGMVSRIRENRPPEFLSIEHIGTVTDGKEDTSSEAVKGWEGALENYTLKDLGGRTELLVEMDTSDEFREMFLETWPKALSRLKSLAEE